MASSYVSTQSGNWNSASTWNVIYVSEMEAVYHSNIKPGSKKFDYSVDFSGMGIF